MGRATALRQLAVELARLGDAEAMATCALACVGEVLTLHWASATLRLGAERSVYRWGDCTDESLEGADRPETHDPGRLLPDLAAQAQVVPLVATGITIGHLSTGPRRDDQPLARRERTFVATVAPMLAVALQRAWLADELERQIGRLEGRERALSALSGRLMRVQEEERRRLALDLHDDPLQRAILLLRDMDGVLATHPWRPRCLSPEEYSGFRRWAHRPQRAR